MFVTSSTVKTDSFQSPKGGFVDKKSVPILSSYKEVSSTLKYGILATLPLLILYIIGRDIFHASNQIVMILNSEVILRKTMTLFGVLPSGFTDVFFVVLVAFLCLRESARCGLIDPKIWFFQRTMTEALLYAGFLIAVPLVLWIVNSDLSNGVSKYPLSALFPFLVMKSGAGFLEEFLCRFILLNGIMALLGKLSSLRFGNFVVALFVSSFAFAEMHYFHFFPELGTLFGITGDVYSTGEFLFRFWAGACFGMIYLYRGFGTAVWTHTLYGYLSLIPNFV